MPGQERASSIKEKREDAVLVLVLVVAGAASAVVVGLLCCYVYRPRDAGEDEPATARHVCFIAEILIVVRGSLENRSNSHLEKE